MAQAPNAGEAAGDKRAYNLFNPTPTALLRYMSTDGFGATESPYTVDAGHFQVELTLVGYTRDRDSYNGVTQRFDAWDIAPVALKLGVLNRLDAQLMLEPYHLEFERADGDRLKLRGFGDTTLRLKYNLLGNDRGRLALAAIPFIRFPTSARRLGNSRQVGGGLIFPLAVSLSENCDLGLTTGFDLRRDFGARGYHTEWLNSVELGHSLVGDLDGYVEFSSVTSTARGTAWMGTVNTGLIYWLSKDLHIFAGVNIGVTRSADDLSPFIGLTKRF